MRLAPYTLILIFILGCKTIERKINELSWTNPIRQGLNSYGMKDFYVFYDSDSFYLVGSEYENPFKGYQGLNLYKSNNLSEWHAVHRLIDYDNIPENAWYKNGWFAPEIKKIKEKYYLTFNSRNNKENPYQKTGFGIAVSNSFKGKFEVINTQQPIILGNHGSLTYTEENDETFLTYDMDGRVYIAEIQLDNAQLLTEPKELLGPDSLGDNYKFVDAPQITKVDKTYHMLFSQFYGGYIVKIFHLTASHPMGDWKWDDNNPIYTFLEAEADMEVKNEYPEKHGYAPPTQVVFSNQIFKGPSGRYFNAYHSSEKYSEPFLCIEPIEFKHEKLIIINKKEDHQTIKFP